MKWQPIETAPKDGTEIFGTGIDFKGNRFYWVCQYDISNKKFVDCHGYLLGDFLTKWMPIAPPEDDQQISGGIQHHPV